MAYLVTGMAATDHVTGDDDSSFNRGVVGPNDYWLTDAAASPVESSSGTITLPKMEVSIMGTHCRVVGSETVTLTTGSQGLYRNDLICGTYTKDASTSIESFAIEVVQGTAGSSAADPSLTQGNIRNGALKRQVPLFRVKLYGSNIQSIERVIPIVDSLYKHQQAYNSLVGTVNSVSSKANTAYSQSATNKNDITGLKSKLDFSGVLRSISTYAKAAVSSWVSSYGTNGAPAVLGAKLAVQNASGTEQASLRIYSDHQVSMMFGETAYFLDRNYVQHGNYTFINPSVGNILTHEITFEKAYTEAPMITATVNTSKPNKSWVSVSNVSKTGFTLYFQRDDSVVDTKVYWQASGKVG